MEITVFHYIEFTLMRFQKSVDSGQPAQSAQADLSRNFLLYVNFLRVKGSENLLI